MKKTPFAGLTVLEPGEGLDTDSGAFSGNDRLVIDRLLQVGARLHRHTGAAGLEVPTLAPSGAVIASGGTIGPELSITLGYTLEDESGGETTLSPLSTVTTGFPLALPVAVPSAAIDYSAGSLLANTYYYGVTWIDGDGGETPLGPVVEVERAPGFASGRVNLTNLNFGAAGAGAVGWKLYRATGGGSFDYVTAGSLAESALTDDGTLPVQCSVHPPLDLENSTRSVNTLQVTLPNADANMAKAVGINLYATLSGDFGGASLLAAYPIASAGKAPTFAALELLDRMPPDVNLSIGGAHQIDPDTELLDWHWKRPVTASANLGSGLLGDVRLAENTGALYAILLPRASAANPAQWTQIASAGGGGGGPGEVTSVFGRKGVVVAASGDYNVTLIPGAVASGQLIAEEVARASGDITERNLRSAADAAEAGIRGSADTVEAAARASGDISERNIRSAADAAEAGIRASADTIEKASRESISSLLLASGIGFIQHGSASAVARPGGFKAVLWEGSVEPAFAGSADLIAYENSAAVHVPTASVFKAAGQSLAGANFTELLFDSEDYDNSGIHSTTSNTGRLTAPKAGVYLVTCEYALLPGAPGLYQCVITKNGTNFASQRGAIEANGLSEVQAHVALYLNAGDYVTFLVYNSKATAQSTQTGGSRPQVATMTWLGTGLRTSEAVDWGIVTSLPGAPEVGDYCTYKVEEGVYWRLQYTGEATYPWTKIGGPPIYKADIAARESSSETKAESAATKITVPLAMEADIEFGCSLAAAKEAALSAGRLAIYKNATTELDWAAMGGSSIFDGASLAKDVRTTLAKSDAVADFYRVEVAGKKVGFTNMWLKIDPVRVG